MNARDATMTAILSQPDTPTVARELCARLIAVAPRVALGSASYVWTLGLAALFGELGAGDLDPGAVDWGVLAYMVESLERDFPPPCRGLN